MGGPRRKKSARAGSRRRPAALGNDPFERGAAEREVAEVRPAQPGQAEGAAAAGRGVPVVPVDSAPAPASTATSSPTSTPTATSVPPAGGSAERVAAVERRLEAALDGVEAKLHDVAVRAGMSSAPEELREALARLLPAVKDRFASALDLLRLLEPAERLDRFGMDPRFAERLEPLVELLHATWWRVAVRDASRVPASGPAVVVANHGGTVPWDAFVLRHALRREHPAHRELRPMLDDSECDLPVLGAAAVRYGAVRASPDAAASILGSGGVIAVFPEGSAAARKPWRDRYRLQRFGRVGFVKVALRAGATIVPCAIVGSEEASPAISRAGWLAERLGLPLLPGTASLRLGAAALLPLPSRWTLRFGEAVDLSGHEPAAAQDQVTVNAIAERVRTALQAMLDEDVAARTSVFL